MKPIKLVLIFIPFIFLNGCVITTSGSSFGCENTLDVKGDTKLDQFQSVKILGALNVTFIQSDENKIVWSGSTEEGKPISITNNENNLELASPNGCSKDLQVTVFTNQETKSLEVSGASTLDMEPDLLEDKVYIEASGASTVVTQEVSVDKLELELSGASSISTGSIKSANIYISGASSASFENLSEIEGRISGASRLDTNSENLDKSKVSISDVSYID